MIKGKVFIKVIVNILVGVLLVVVVLSAFSMLQAKRNPNKIPAVMGLSTMSVLSGSMRPMIEPGDMIITKRPKFEDINIGDVITYRVSDNTLVTHRVVDIIKEDNQIMFQTQGDANNTIDFGYIASEDIVGTYLFRIPKGGYIVNSIRNPLGFALLVLLPVILLIGNELRTILFEVRKQQKT